MADWIELIVLAMGQGACNLVKEYRNDRLIYLALNDFGSEDFPDDDALGGQHDIIFDAMRERAREQAAPGVDLYLDDLVITHKDTDHISYLKSEIFDYCNTAVVKTTSGGNSRHAFVLPKSGFRADEEDEADYQHVLFCEISPVTGLVALEYQHAEEMNDAFGEWALPQGVRINDHTTTFYYECVYRYQHVSKKEKLQCYYTAGAQTNYSIGLGGQSFWGDAAFAANVKREYNVNDGEVTKTVQEFQIVDMLTIPFEEFQYTINIDLNARARVGIISKEMVMVTLTVVATIKRNDENLAPVLSKTEFVDSEMWITMDDVVQAGADRVTKWMNGWVDSSDELRALGEFLKLEICLFEKKCMDADKLEETAIEGDREELFDPEKIYEYFKPADREPQEAPPLQEDLDKLYINRCMMGGVPNIYTGKAEAMNEAVKIFCNSCLRTPNSGAVLATAPNVGHRLYTFFLLRGSSENASSLVSLYTYNGNDNILLPGDATRATMNEMVKLYGKRELPSNDTIVVAPHHGSFETARNGSKTKKAVKVTSPTRTLEEFLRAVRPKTMIVNASHKSTYGHPHKTFMIQANKSMTLADRSDHMVLMKNDDNRNSTSFPWFRLALTTKRLYTCAMPEMDGSRKLTVPCYNYTMANNDIQRHEIARLEQGAIKVNTPIDRLDNVTLQAEEEEPVRPVNLFSFVLP